MQRQYRHRALRVPLPHWPVPPNPLESGIFSQNPLETSLKQLINILPLVKSPWPCLILFQVCYQFPFLELFHFEYYHFLSHFPPSRLCFSRLNIYILQYIPFSVGEFIHSHNQILEQKGTLAIISPALFWKRLHL